MSKEGSRIVVIALIFACTKGHGAYWGSPNQLHPVQGLYVKPSNDGTTGDLYVAATEDSGVKTQWLTDQPVNFLPVAAATKPQQTTVPVTFTSSYPITPHEESVTAQKRAVIASPPVQYAYAMPVSSGVSSENNKFTPYPYAISASSSTPPSSQESSTTPQCVIDPASSNIPQYSPFHFFYPHMMSAFTNAMTVLKEAGLSEDTAGSIMSQATPMWPPSSYGYPMYVMVDPNAWAQSQSTTPTSSSAAVTDN